MFGSYFSGCAFGMSKLLLSEESLTWASVRKVFAPHVELQRNLSGASDVVGCEEEIFLGRDGCKHRGGYKFL